MSRTVAIIACSGKKREGRHAARDLYTGSLFRSNLLAAEQIADEVFILSAKHGLIEATDQVDAYDVQFGDAESVDQETLTAQVELAELEDADVYVLAPKAYWSRLWSIEVDGWCPQWVNEACRGVLEMRKTARICRESSQQLNVDPELLVPTDEFMVSESFA